MNTKDLIILTVLCYVSICGSRPDTLESIFGNELPTIRAAAARNGCGGDCFYILLAIRKAENGGNGKQFGILVPGVNTLDKQAGWAAATIMKNVKRWEKAGKQEDFIVFLGRRYCPICAANDQSGLNSNWVRNVRAWANYLKSIDK